MSERTTPPAPLGFCHALKPRCPAGHRLKIDPVATDRLLTCPVRIGGQGPCGLHAYLVKVHVLGEALLLVVPLTRAQLLHLSAEPLTALERLAYLGLALPGVAHDLESAA